MEKVLVPADRFDSQTLLDIRLTTNAYQLGVDKLEFRSEKSFSAGVVVMEIRYDRLVPKNDRFEVTVMNLERKIVRKERYDRKQIDKTDHELVVEFDDLKRNRDAKETTADEKKKLEAYESRLAVISTIFPKTDEKQKKEEKVNAPSR